MSNQRKRPRDRASWDQRYVDGELLWDTGEPGVHLPGVIERHNIAPANALEIGCGTGTNSIWLAQHGFEVTGTDLAPTAIARAEARERFASRVAELLAPTGIWHSLIGSTDGPPRDSGPPRHSAGEVIAELG